MFHTFWPLTIHSSPSRTARVASPARSEPAPGSEKSWHQISSPVNIGRSARLRSSSLPCVTIVGPASDRPKNSMPCGAARPPRAGAGRCGAARAAASPRPPKPSGKCTHASPRSYCAPRNVIWSVRRGIVRGEQVVDRARRRGSRSSSAMAVHVYFVVAMPPSTGITAPVTYDAGPAGEEDRGAGHVVGAADAAERRRARDRVAEVAAASRPSSSTRTARARSRSR